MAAKKNRDDLTRTVFERELRDPTDSFALDEPMMASGRDDTESVGEMRPAE